MSAVRANQATLAKILRTSSAGISKAKKIPGFPEPNDDNEFDIRDVVLWWHKHKEGGCEPDGSADLKSERETLELQLKEADVQLKLRDLIRVSEIRGDLQRFAAKLSDALEAVERTTGQPIDGIVEPVFDEFFRALEKRVKD